MALPNKPEIQYVGQFYVYGSEAKKLERKPRPVKSRREKEFVRQNPVRVISVDPVAMIGLVVAVIMLAALAVGALQISTTWQEYDQIEAYLAELKQENARLDHEYRTGYDLAEIEQTALAIGMIPATEANTIIVRVSVPEPEPEPTIWEDIVWFMKGLLA